MQKTAIPAPLPLDEIDMQSSRPRSSNPFLQVLHALASLRLTVVLFMLSFFLVFVGTLAQMEGGIWTVVNQYFRSGLVWVPFQLFVKFGQVFFGLPQTMNIPGSFPFPGGWAIGSVLLVNLLAAHALRFKLSWKRSGILLIHSGLIVMMLGELTTGLFAREGKMTLKEGESSNYVEHHDTAELAIIDPSDSKTEDVVVIPEKMLRSGQPIQHDKLPFDVVVDRYFVNSTLPDKAAAGEPNPATAGDGLTELVMEKPPVSGVDTDQQVDVASAYVTFKEKGTGKAIGTYLVSLWYSGISEVLPNKPQQVKLGGKTYDVYLRMKRSYKPYVVQLKEFKHDLYLGTDKPKNFSSQVQLLDPDRGTDREVLIYMNNPLRYNGETFYQSGFLRGDRGTILQVVQNPGWLLPYISCAMVSIGMLIHFGLHLVKFLRQRAAISKGVAS